MSKQQDITPIVPSPAVNAWRMLGYLLSELEVVGEISIESWNAAVAASEGK